MLVIPDGIRTFVFNGYEDSYEDIMKRVLYNIVLEGQYVFVEPDERGKRSGGATHELKDVLIIISRPKKPTVEEFNMLVKNVGKRFMNLDRDFLYEKYNVDKVVDKLKNKPHTRSAVIFPNIKIDENYIHCVIAGQFLVRNDNLSLRVWMRSNDAYNALIGNIMEFTYIMHEVADELSLIIDKYIHYATSLHIYEIDMKDAIREVSSQ